MTKAKRIVEAMKQAAKEGKGAVSLDGRLIDLASIRQAESLLNKAKRRRDVVARPYLPLAGRSGGARNARRWGGGKPSPTLF